MKGKVVFITGASSGIGRALAVELAGRGAHVVLAARRLDRLTALAESLSQKGARAIAVACDVTVPETVRRAAQTAREELGGIDIVIANAGFGVVGAVDKLSLDDYRRQWETNVFGVLTTVQATVGDLKKSRGRLALMGSVVGYLGLPQNSPYTTSKFAVRGLAESLRLELYPFGVSVTHVAPGFIASEIRMVDNRGVHHPDASDWIPGFLLMPADRAARQIARAVRRRRREVVLTFHGKAIVFLVRHFPRLTYLLLRTLRARGRSEPR